MNAAQKTFAALVLFGCCFAAFARGPAQVGDIMQFGRVDGGTLPVASTVPAGVVYDALIDRHLFSSAGTWASLLPRAGAVFNGATASCPAGVCVVGDGLNVTSITWNSTGRYTVVMPVTMTSTTAYTILVTAGSGDKAVRWVITNATTFALECDNSLTQAAADCSLSFVVFNFK